MCGIIGMLDFSKTGFTTSDLDFFKELMVYNSLRGKDSTGIFSGRYWEKPDYIKQTGNPYDLFNNSKTKTFFNRVVTKNRFMVGHGRWATKGAVNAANAHPFQVEHITMVHNGTVFGSRHVDTKEHDVDSLALAHALANHPYEEVIPEITGAFAIAWHDSKDQKIRLVRNGDRPLYLARSDALKCYYFASEAGMLSLAASRNKLKIDEMHLIPEYCVYEFNYPDFTFEVKKLKKKSYIYQAPEVKQLPVVAENKGNIVQIDKRKKLEFITNDLGIKYSVGDSVHFFIDEVTCLSNRNDKEISQVFGGVFDSPSIEATFIWKGDSEPLYHSSTVSGTITGIAKAGNTQNPDIKYTFYVSNPEFDKVVITANNVPYTDKEFIEATKDGCTACKRIIVLAESEDTLILDKGCLCKKCVKSAEDMHIDPESLLPDVKQAVMH